MRLKILLFLYLLWLQQGVAQLPKPVLPLKTQSSEQERQIKQQNESIYKQENKRLTQQQDIQEVRRAMQKPAIKYEFPEIQTELSQHYKTAMAEIVAMLEGKQTLSLRRAVFLSENPFFGNTLNYEQFNNAIDMEVDVLEAFMKKEGYALDDDMAKKYFLQRFMSDTLVMRDAKGRIQFTHLPYKYDFDDPMGAQDPRKQFVTKLLFEKKGQCHSMPLLYLIFAEALNVKAWLSYAPLHSYVKLQDKKGIWLNFETTNGHYSSNSWILSSGYINASALKNHIYMDTLSPKQTVAVCLLDLTKTYTERCGYDKFLLDCAEKTLEYHPNDIQALEAKSNYYTYLFDFVAKQLQNPPVSMLSLYPKAEFLYKQMHAFYAALDKTGFQNIPENVYQDWLKSFELEKQKQPIQVIKP